jgi:hypothetical protein
VLDPNAASGTASPPASLTGGRGHFGSRKAVREFPVDLLGGVARRGIRVSRLLGSAKAL